MKKAMKIWLITAAVIILIGCFVFGGVMMFFNWDFTKLSTVKLETNRHEISESYRNISIVGDTADVVFLPSQDGTTSVTCREHSNEKHTVSVTDDTLVVELKNTKKWYEYIGINFGRTKITLSLPQEEYGDLVIRQDTGDVEIPKDFSFQTVNITTETGDVKNLASASGDVKIKTSTGDIHAVNISAQNLDLSVSTGDITATSLTCGGDISVQVTTGETALTDVFCQNLTSTGTTGDVFLKNVLASKKFSITRSTGDVIFENSDAAEVLVETNTGDVKGSLRTEKIFLVQTNTGRKDVPESVSGGKCKITTNTGDVKISIIS